MKELKSASRKCDKNRTQPTRTIKAMQKRTKYGIRKQKKKKKHYMFVYILTNIVIRS